VDAIEALNEMGSTNNPELKVVIDRVITLEKKLQEKQSSIDSLNNRIKVMLQREIQLGQKIEMLTNEKSSLKVTPSQVDQYESQRSKIRQLKSLIGEMQEYIKGLPQESTEQPINLDEQDVFAPVKDSKIDVEEILAAKVVGIIGGFSEQIKIRKNYSCEVRTATGKDLNDVEDLVDKSDIVIVLTQHVSHAAMWLSKECAIDYGKPIVFSKHENISIILTDAAAAVS
jgi:chromosome segregation ATPase